VGEDIRGKRFIGPGDAEEGGEKFTVPRMDEGGKGET